MIKFVDLLEEYGGGEFEVPENHKAGLRVPKGGSCCANCKWWVHKGDSEEYHCASKYYQKWAGTDTIPYAADEYCTNWWEPRENLDKEKAEK